MGGRGSGRKRTKRAGKYNPKPLSNIRKLYERQNQESDRAWEAFCIYRDLGFERSQEKVAARLGKSTQLMAAWSVTWSWRKRADAWDMEKDRQQRAADLQAIFEMRKRHIKTSTMMQGLGSVELAKFFKMSQKKDENGQDVPPVLEVGDAMRLVELGMKIERLNRGEPESIQEETLRLTSDDKRDRLRAGLQDADVVGAMNTIAKRLNGGGGSD